MSTTPAPWARRAAHAAALTTVPSGVWRVALACGLPVGYSEADARRLFDVPGAGTFQLIGLSLLLEGLALMTLGLVHGWGEVAPRWLPLIGSRPVPVAAAVVPATLGALALTALWVPFAVLWWVAEPDPALSAGAHTVVGLTYMPLALWGPLLGLVTLSYARRRRSSCPCAVDQSLVKR